ncbi:hypothetical protein SAMN00017477_0568 [Peptoniphilus asaccharolyticus DSM 20463]|uniref:Pyridoxal phosphate homeostasis protein n=1 Tax=Peptoniphilus asaccharolyticus DSM 20463 TaxID=573058 RepID=A0A1W1UQP8_PEPAS|nr:YggS family pyridoxal phosphate-dependent enzyme [Peptoniphilus asaccharolyticus]MBL7575042.1 YggS family pyridoxal phosphate-dependent enzyme [Peptoniphilus asaccharolyticus]MBL7575067.1 YggS family pyridoxal phosphate-dependent enzyme [Peptoniphilus asaccharolyticus]SMB83468.1 hypothetical protein SAMN00017477_0568 [Peptoniphilus asaccharolyticus DSM 20463]
MSIKLNMENLLREVEDLEKKSITGEKVRLIAVSKMHSTDEILEAVSGGAVEFGENKVQELRDKLEVLPEQNFHMIGNLQTNKVKYIYDKVRLIQSLDRVNLLEEIDKRAKSSNIVVDCLIEVNIAGEEQKGGVAYNDVRNFLEKCLEYNNVKIQGLMTVAPDTEDEKLLRDCFKRMFKLKEKIKNNYSEVKMDILSMGMSQDYKLAIEEGSNMVRIGSKIFGKRIGR